VEKEEGPTSHTSVREEKGKGKEAEGGSEHTANEFEMSVVFRKLSEGKYQSC
jgi:hypothetical protein